MINIREKRERERRTMTGIVLKVKEREGRKIGYRENTSKTVPHTLVS